MLITILATIVVLGVLIFIHELGHFMTAKWVDIEVPRFSIGFGPKVIGFRRGETEYVISLLPLGGYVKMAGMEEMEQIEGGPDAPRISGAATADDTGIEVKEPRTAGPRDFESKSLPARTLVISAGVIMNLLFAVAVFAAIAGIWGVQKIADARVGEVIEELLPAGTEPLAHITPGTRITRVGNDNVSDMREVTMAIATAPAGPLEIQFDQGAPVRIQVPSADSMKGRLIAAFQPAVQTPARVGEVIAGTAAARAGLQPGDEIVRAAGQPVTSWQQFKSIIERRPGENVPLTIEREGRQLTIDITPTPSQMPNGEAFGRIGLTPAVPEASALPKERLGFFAAIGHGFSETWTVVALTVEFLKDLLTGQASPRNLGGPIEIGRLSGQVVRLGFEQFLGFMALFSVNLAVLNLLPIPILDGGHLMFLAVEAVRGRALSLQTRMRLSQVGFLIVLAIMLWAVTNDVLKRFGI